MEFYEQEFAEMNEAKMNPRLSKIYETIKEKVRYLDFGMVIDIGTLVEEYDISPEEAILFIQYYRNDPEVILKKSYVLCYYENKIENPLELE